MKCPRCKEINENTRTICSKCGFYMYRNSTTPRSRMTPEQIAKMDRQIMWGKVKTVLKWIWRGIVILVVTYWIIALIVILASGAGVSLF